MPTDRAAAIEKRNLALGKTVRDWEGAVCDVFAMSDVVTALLSGAFSDESKALSGLPNTYLLHQEEVARLFFVASQLEKMIDTFKDRYYAAIEA